MIDRVEVIEALRKIKEDCQDTNCLVCPIGGTDEYGHFLGCRLEEMMVLGGTFELPHFWKIDKLEG